MIFALAVSLFCPLSEIYICPVCNPYFALCPWYLSSLFPIICPMSVKYGPVGLWPWTATPGGTGYCSWGPPSPCWLWLLLRQGKGLLGSQPTGRKWKINTKNTFSGLWIHKKRIFIHWKYYVKRNGNERERERTKRHMYFWDIIKGWTHKVWLYFKLEKVWLYRTEFY